jgi:hypothetical protein
MVKITIYDLSQHDSETFIRNLINLESNSIFGGADSKFSQPLKLGVKFLEFMVAMYAIDGITYVAKSFNSTK